MRVIDLFSGIGGFSYGLESTGGFSTIAFCENDPFCRKLLQKHWPDTPIFDDVTELSIEAGAAEVICGGFPCQDVSNAGGGQTTSLLGNRSGLWFHYARVIAEAKPNWVIIENVEALRNKGLIIILRQLADLGYDAEWHLIPAYAVGLPHRRKRLWIIAHNMQHRVEGGTPFPLQRLAGFSWHSPERGFANFFGRSGVHAPRLCRSIHGIPSGVDRLRVLGNSVVPPIPYAIGQAILDWENGGE